jgi:Uma2 family endonuclease
MNFPAFNLRRFFMQATAPKAPFITVEEYLAREREAEYKSEYLNGEIFAMAGASRPHNLIVSNICGEFYIQLKNRVCSVYPSDMRLKVSATGLYTYPDVMVACGEERFDDDNEDTLLNPTLIVEVLSKSTERQVRGAKFEHYSKLGSLQEYLLAAQHRPRLELFTKQGPGRWLLTEFESLDDVVKLTSINCELALKNVYLKVNFPEAETAKLQEPVQKSQ